KVKMRMLNMALIIIMALTAVMGKCFPRIRGVWLLKTRMQTEQALLDLKTPLKSRLLLITGGSSASLSRVLQNYLNGDDMFVLPQPSSCSNSMVGLTSQPDAISPSIVPCDLKTFSDDSLRETGMRLLRRERGRRVMKEGRRSIYRKG